MRAARWLLRYDLSTPDVVLAWDVIVDPGVTLEAPLAIARGTRLTGVCEVGRGTTIGEGCTVNGPVSIGRYCQIGSAVGIFGTSHPTDRLTTYVGGHLDDELRAGARVSAPTTISHDVWIGHGAVITAGVSIGTSAVIGANAVVTQDVPAFGIAVGAPARTVRSRLDALDQQRISDLRWWDWPPDELSSRLRAAAAEDDAVAALLGLAGPT